MMAHASRCIWRHAVQIGARLLVLVSFCAGAAAQAQSALPQQEGWITGTSVTLQTLDKITARIATTEAKLSQPVRFGTLEITAFHCAYRPPEAPPETAAFLQIKDVGYTDTKEEAAIVFSGWMFASSPAISGLEHSVYDVTVLACAK